jgi:hypothetical protein
MPGKHNGKRAEEPKTAKGKAWDEMTPAEKAAEFDASYARPISYAHKHFSGENQGQNGRKPKHKRVK